MTCAMCLVDVGGLETSRTESAAICPKQPLQIVVFVNRRRRRVLINCQGGGDAATPRPASEKPP